MNGPYDASLENLKLLTINDKIINENKTKISVSTLKSVFDTELIECLIRSTP